jgi:hypothetical protein
MVKRRKHAAAFTTQVVLEIIGGAKSQTRNVPDRHRRLQVAFVTRRGPCSPRARARPFASWPSSAEALPALRLRSRRAPRWRSLQHWSGNRFCAGQRYQMHTLLRQWATARLAQDTPRQQAVRRRHAGHLADHGSRRSLGETARWRRLRPGDRMPAASGRRTPSIRWH